MYDPYAYHCKRPSSIDDDMDTRFKHSRLYIRDYACICVGVSINIYMSPSQQ